MADFGIKFLGISLNLLNIIHLINFVSHQLYATRAHSQSFYRIHFPPDTRSAALQRNDLT